MTGRVVVLTGGVGGAKFVEGLVDVLPPQDVVAIVNTGDDFEHLGLAVSPDLDTLLYTLSGLTDRQRGWGRAYRPTQLLQMVSWLHARQTAHWPAQRIKTFSISGGLGTALERSCIGSIY